MSKAKLSADDFLRAIAGEPEELPVPGLGCVMVRPLTVLEVQRIYAEAQNEPATVMALAALYGMVEPKLPESAAETLKRGAAGPIIVVARRIMELSGMTDGEALEGEAGAG